MKRRKTRLINVGNVNIGGNSEITIQSMCNTKTKDADATIKQIKELEKAGCDIVRVSVEDMDDVFALKEIKQNINIPLAAGLGGGSSDAAAVIKGMNKLFEIEMSEKEKIEIAAKIGMDVPFFIIGGTTHVTGKGEKINRIDPLPKNFTLF